MSQLRLEKDDLDNVPEIPLPEGYALRTYREGDEIGIARIYAASMMGNGTEEEVCENLLRHPCFKPERIFVVEHGNELVGAAAAWIETGNPGVGCLHMVGTFPEHRGKRLGSILTIAAITYSRNEGFTRQQLATDDWREPALRMYLNLGYYPLITDETHPTRWEAIAKRLGRTDIVVRAKTLTLDGAR
jgi:mycothiol synthase